MSRRSLASMWIDLAALPAAIMVHIEYLLLSRT
jgi:hypothetical protein